MKRLGVSIGLACLLTCVAASNECTGFYAFRVAWKEETAGSRSSEAPALEKDADDDEASPTSPLSRDAPPQEEPTLDVEQPVEIAIEAP